MTVTSYIFGVLSALLILTVVIVMLAKKRLRERHALWWLAIGVLVLIAAIAPSLLASVANLIGITLPVSLVFFVGIVVLFLVSLQHSAELTKLEEQTRILAEKHALLELKLRESGQTPNESNPTN